MPGEGPAQPLEVGIYFFPTAEGAVFTDVAQAIEERGLESVFVPEHSHFPATTEAFVDPDGKPLPERYRRIYDPFVALAAAAAVTTKLRLGTAACIVTQRDVLLTAKAAATLDQLSHGRLLFGVGAGWNFGELRTHGVNPRDRFSILEETVEALRRIWVDSEPEFHGRHIDFGPVWLWPKPVQEPGPPVLIAGDGKSVLDRVLRYGDGWLPTHRGKYDLKRRIEELRSRALEMSRKRPSVTFVAASADEQALIYCLEAGVDRALLPITPGSFEAVANQLDKCERARDSVRG